MSSKGSSPAGNTTTTSGPPSWAQPYFSGGMQSASNLYGTPMSPAYYPGQQVAPFSPLQEQGLQQTQQTAESPNQYNQSAGNYFNTLESGQMLNPASNPALQGLANQSFQQIQNNLATQFAGGGRNIEASAPVQASQMGNIANQIYGGAYNNTLSNMTGALGQSNNLIAGQYAPAQQLMGAGGAVQQQAQNLDSANQNIYNYYQNLPYSQLSNYMSTISGIPIGKQTQTPYFTNPLAGGLGGAMAGAQIGSAVPGIGTGFGALGGGVLGLLGSGG